MKGTSAAGLLFLSSAALSMTSALLAATATAGGRSASSMGRHVRRSLSALGAAGPPAQCPWQPQGDLAFVQCPSQSPAASSSGRRPPAFGLPPRLYRSAPGLLPPVRPFTSPASASAKDTGGVQAVEEPPSETEQKEPQPTLAATLLSRPDFAPKASAYALPPPAADSLTDLEEGRRIVAFGDVHGDLGALRSFLVTAGVLDPESPPDDPRWSGGNTICVQTGDVLDRGDDELACLRLLASLSRQARGAGGELILLLGNHESLNFVGLYHYANPGGNEEFEHEVGEAVDAALGSNRWRLMYAGNQPSRWAAMEPGGILARDLLSNMKVAQVVGRTVFVHAGLTASHLREYGSLEEINRSAREYLLDDHHGENNYEGSYETVAEVVESAKNRARAQTRTLPSSLGGGGGEKSPVWMRDYSSPGDGPPSNPAAGGTMGEALDELGMGVQRMVMGHTPQKRINAALGGRAWRVDVGASRGVMGGTPEVLEIIHGGEGKEDVVTVLTMSGDRIPSSDRQIMEDIMF